MKIRQGFVSNSSSSSFVITLPGKIDTIQNLAETFGIPADSLGAKALYKLLGGIVNLQSGDFESPGKFEYQGEIEECSEQVFNIVNSLEGLGFNVDHEC